MSQSTVSRAVTALTPLLGTALAQYVPVAEDLSPHAHGIVDGTLLPCWSWAAHPELYSGKQRLRDVGTRLPSVAVPKFRRHTARNAASLDWCGFVGVNPARAW